MEYRNERLDKLVGQAMLIKYLDGPDADEESLNNMVEEPGWRLSSNAMASSALYRLLGYDAVGITVKTHEEGSTNVFIPWGAVLGIYGATDGDEA